MGLSVRVSVNTGFLVCEVVRTGYREVCEGTCVSYNLPCVLHAQPYRCAFTRMCMLSYTARMFIGVYSHLAFRTTLYCSAFSERVAEICIDQKLKNLFDVMGRASFRRIPS